MSAHRPSLSVKAGDGFWRGVWDRPQGEVAADSPAIRDLILKAKRQFMRILYIYIYMFACMHVRMYVYICVYACMYIYIYYWKKGIGQVFSKTTFFPVCLLDTKAVYFH